MNETQARVFREAHDHYVKTISRKSKTQLVTLTDQEMTVYGGTRHWSKDELVSALVELRYPLAKLNESIHVLYHVDGITNDVCEWCA